MCHKSSCHNNNPASLLWFHQTNYCQDSGRAWGDLTAQGAGTWTFHVKHIFNIFSYFSILSDFALFKQQDLFRLHTRVTFLIYSFLAPWKFEWDVTTSVRIMRDQSADDIRCCDSRRCLTKMGLNLWPSSTPGATKKKKMPHRWGWAACSHCGEILKGYVR